MIRLAVNAGDFLKCILNVGDFTRKYKFNHYFINAGDSPASTRELECMASDIIQFFFYIDLSYCKERQSCVIPFTSDITNRLYLLYNLLSFTSSSVPCFTYLLCYYIISCSPKLSKIL